MELDDIVYLIESKKMFLDRGFDLAALSVQINCSEKIVESLFISCAEIEFTEYLDCLRVMYSRKLLLEMGECTSFNWRYCGFKSYRAYKAAVERVVY